MCVSISFPSVNKSMSVFTLKLSLIGAFLNKIEGSMLVFTTEHEFSRQHPGVCKYIPLYTINLCNDIFSSKTLNFKQFSVQFIPLKWCEYLSFGGFPDLLAFSSSFAFFTLTFLSLSLCPPLWLQFYLLSLSAAAYMTFIYKKFPFLFESWTLSTQFSSCSVVLFPLQLLCTLLSSSGLKRSLSL